MAGHTGIFATLAEITFKVGENADTTGFVEANINNACAQAESLINALCKYNFTDAYAGLNADVKRILSEAAACWVAVDFISYNMNAYTSRSEAESMINLLWAKFNKLIEVLQNQSVVSYLKVA